MADNVTLNSMTGGAVVASDEVTDGTLGTAQVQYVKLMDGTINGTGKGAVDATYGLAVDIKRTVNVVLGTGSNVIGAVTQSGTWNVGSITTLPALPAGSNTIGTVLIGSGISTIGNVVQGNGLSSGTLNPWFVAIASGATLGQGSASPTTTATLIASSSTARRSITITNTGSVQVNIGGSGVIATTGLPLVPGASATFDGAARGSFYGITASGTGSVAYITESD